MLCKQPPQQPAYVRVSEMKRLMPGQGMCLYRYQYNGNDEITNKLIQSQSLEKKARKLQHRLLINCQPIIFEQMQSQNRQSSPLDDIEFIEQ